MSLKLGLGALQDLDTVHIHISPPGIRKPLPLNPMQAQMLKDRFLIRWQQIRAGRDAGGEGRAPLSLCHCKLAVRTRVRAVFGGMARLSANAPHENRTHHTLYVAGSTATVGQRTKGPSHGRGLPTRASASLALL